MNLFDFLGHFFRPRPRPVTPPPPPPSPQGGGGPATPDPTGLAGDLLTAINRARSSAGLARLIHDPALSAVASSWAAQMARVGRLDHGDFGARVASVRPGVVAGEDIGEGFASGAAEVAAWLGDPPHRKILLGNW
jgi:uncharacterized protein YkwD